jgi:tetratricopeptide (TPR) repeat protein
VRPYHGFSEIERELALGIQKTKARLIEFPHNPVLWSNLSLLYTSLGQAEKADRAMRIALTLARDNRHIVRSAARLFHHQGEKEKAHDLVSRANNLHADPWILAAEIALAASRKKTSKNIRSGRKLLEAGRHSAFHLSELASALGTLEIQNGNRRGGQKLIGKSLEDPSENSIAQATWLARQHYMAPVSSIKLSLSAEAKSRQSWACGDWETAIKEVNTWQFDHPFSSNPPLLASNIFGTVYGDYVSATLYLESGFRSNPNAFEILNDLAFSQANLNIIDRAQKIFDRIDVNALDMRKKVVYMATKGFLDFRSGREEIGMKMYHTKQSSGHCL